MSSQEKIRVQHFLHEYQTWERILDFFKLENAFLKTRLAEFLDDDSNDNFLQLAENFQTQFLQKDELINDLKADIIKMEATAMKKKATYDKISFITIERIQKKLRNEMEQLERDFLILKNEFNKCIVSAL